MGHGKKTEESCVVPRSEARVRARTRIACRLAAAIAGDGVRSASMKAILISRIGGPELASRAILRWLHGADIETTAIDPGKPR